ncbi:unnamed protein product [Cuscuta epithymum]|uniref:Uncharacterized protein n=1 Tax=Cuscuta epithymum TaxID=186058 RepID=A0AAV0GG92_9ASTE|nr:unnamed protein product [Cuscuta epithymum]
MLSLVRMLSSNHSNSLTQLSAPSATSHGGGYYILPEFHDHNLYHHHFHQFSWNTHNLLVNFNSNSEVNNNIYSNEDNNAGNTYIGKESLLFTGRPEKAAAKKKDRHTKIMTAQGQRDRRVRLSISIAQKFFHLQDTLGLDKPSKTLNWLLAKSKQAIEELNHAAADSPPSSAVKDGVSPETSKTRARACSIKVGKKIFGVNKSNDAAKESRAKARARARERTIKKMFIRELSEANLLLPAPVWSTQPPLPLVEYPLDYDDVAAKEPMGNKKIVRPCSMWDCPQHLMMPKDLGSVDSNNNVYSHSCDAANWNSAATTTISPQVFKFAEDHWTGLTSNIYHS